MKEQQFYRTIAIRVNHDEYAKLEKYLEKVNKNSPSGFHVSVGRWVKQIALDTASRGLKK